MGNLENLEDKNGHGQVMEYENSAKLRKFMTNRDIFKMLPLFVGFMHFLVDSRKSSIGLQRPYFPTKKSLMRNLV